MLTSAETAALIRTRLTHLGEENAHHEFEHLCRHVARLRIASNILPATGPVSAGGDQARDFETFRTYLAQGLPFATGFLALAAEDTIVFACTIQQDRLKAKFRADIETICTKGAPVDRICIFAAAGVPTALRHETQDWARDTYDVALDIIDGQGLAEHLAEPDLYWIAHQYLKLPIELAPASPDPDPAQPQWYLDLRDAWKQTRREPSTLGDLLEIRRGLRHARQQGPARTDLDGWLKLAERLIDNTDPKTRLHAVYDVVLARTYGKADLRPVEPLLRQSMSNLATVEDPTILFDLSVLLQTTMTATVFGHTDIPLDEVLSWIPPLRQHVDDLLDRDWGPHTRSALLQTAAHAALNIDYSDVTGNIELTLEDLDKRHEAILEAVEHGGPIPSPGGAAPLVDRDAGMRRLVELTQLLPRLGAFPIDVFAMTIDSLAASLQDHPSYRLVCDGLDEAVQRQQGDAALARKYYQRASALHAAGRPVDAVHEFHQAKINWFHGDTLDASMNALADIAEIYSSLGMHLAAKKYALVLAALAQTSQDPDHRRWIPIALFAAANHDHDAGAWIASADLATIAGLAHLAYAPRPEALDEHSYLTETAKDQYTTLLVARQVRPHLTQTIHEMLQQGPVGQLIAPAIDAGDDPATRTVEEWLDQLPELNGTPFSDAGPERTIAFHTYGIRWTIHGRNDQRTVLALEDLTSTLQILLVDFVHFDPVLIAQDVDIEVRTYPPGETPEQTHLTKLSGDQRLWLLFMPEQPDREDIQEARLHVTALAFKVLLGNSLLDQSHFSALMGNAAEKGLLHKMDIGRPYHELAKFRTYAEMPLSGLRYRPLVHVEKPQPRRGSPHLDTLTTPGPGYSREKSQELIAVRYETLPVPVRHTVPALMRDERVRTLFQQLRADGWKDWHLLNVLVNMTANHRVTLKYGQMTRESAPRLLPRFLEECGRDEMPTDPQIPASEVTADAMSSGIALVAGSCMRHWDLELHNGNADMEAVIRVLADRYGFWNDDVEHQDPFGGQLDNAEGDALGEPNP